MVFQSRSRNPTIQLSSAKDERSAVAFANQDRALRLAYADRARQYSADCVANTIPSFSNSRSAGRRIRIRAALVVYAHRRAARRCTPCQVWPLRRLGTEDLLAGADSDGKRAAGVTIIDSGHQRKRELILEVPNSPPEAVMSNEVW